MKKGMNIKNILSAAFAVVLFFLIIPGCSRKTSPSASKSTESATNKTETAKPTAPKAKRIKPPVAKVIMVNDSVAKKTFDGRLYYDLEGRRYWKNYVDGKYYLYNKSQSTDPAFKKPS